MAHDTGSDPTGGRGSGNPYDSPDFLIGYYGPYYSQGYTPAYWPQSAHGYGPPNSMWGAPPVGNRRNNEDWTRNLSDSDIQNAVYDALDNNPAIPWNAEITVKVKDHVVTLDGAVGNKAMKQAAGYEAWETPGVDDVHNNLQIQGRRRRQSRTPSDGQRTATP